MFFLNRPVGSGSCDDEEKYVEFYKGLFEDLSVDIAENQELCNFFNNNKPSGDFLIAARAMAFKAACDYISDDNDANIKLLKCINVAVHAFEKTCLRCVQETQLLKSSVKKFLDYSPFPVILVPNHLNSMKSRWMLGA